MGKNNKNVKTNTLIEFSSMIWCEVAIFLKTKKPLKGAFE